MDELRHRTFETARGKQTTFSTMEQGHLSNLVHFVKHINPNNHPMIAKLAQQELDRRFRGELLPFYPKYSFEVEILQSKGMLRFNGKGEFDIIFEGEKIGEVRKQAILSNL